MLDPNLVREHLDDVRARLVTRGDGFGGDLDRLVQIDAERRAILPVLETARHARKDVGERIARAKRAGEPVDALIAAGQEHHAVIKAQEAQLESVEVERGAQALRIPNVPHASVPVGRSEADNVEVRRHGEPPRFDFEPRPHWDIGPALGIVDFERAARIAASRFAVLTGAGSATGAGAHQLHARPPYGRAWLHRGGAAVPGEHGRADRDRQPAEVRARPVQGGGPVGPVPDPDGGGAAVQPAPGRDPGRAPAAGALRGLHAVLPERGGLVREGRAGPDPAAPVRQGGAGGLRDPGDVVGGARGADAARRGGAAAAGPAVPDGAAVHRRHGVRGVEDVRPRGVAAGPRRLPRDLVVQQHRGVPGAARGIRFRREGRKGRPEHVHTLNGSGVAVGRALVAILENCQQRDGTVVVPEALRSYMGGIEVIEPASA